MNRQRIHELWWSVTTRTPWWVRHRRDRQREAVTAALFRAVIFTPEGWVLACPYHRGAEGLDALADSIVEAIA
jgi:hypothetical protein